MPVGTEKADRIPWLFSPGVIGREKNLADGGKVSKKDFKNNTDIVKDSVVETRVSKQSIC